MDRLINQYLANKNTDAHHSNLLNLMRASGFDQFQLLGLPSRKDEDWKFTSLRNLSEFNFSVDEDQGAYQCGSLAESIDHNAINIVFINGVLSLEYSNFTDLPSGLTVMPLGAAFDEHPQEVEALLKSYESIPNNGLVALNQAFLKEGVLIRLDKKSSLTKPLHIFYADGDERTVYAGFPRILVSVGENSELTLVESAVGGTSKCLTNVVTNIHLGQGARLRHYKIQNASPQGTYLDHTFSVQERDSWYESFVLAIGGQLARASLNIKIRGQGAEALLNGAYLTRGSQQVDQQVLVTHEVGHSRSAQFYKGMLDGQSKAVFSGKVVVCKDAQKTEARQLNSNLMLSSEAEVDTQPQLEIDADDIKCSHGATIGQLREDEVFYLQTRGLRREHAEVLLGRAFIDEALLKISDLKIQRQVMDLVADILPKVN